MRDDDLLEIDLSAPPSVALRGVRGVVAAPLIVLAMASAPGCTEPVGHSDSGGYDAPPAFDGGLQDVPATVNDAGLSYDAGRVDAPHDADPSVEEDASTEDAGPVDGGPPLDVG
jgi:hypothetical protein